jgi:hypothetical protein
MVQHINGDWPDLDISIDLPPPKEHYSYEELAQNYATLAVHHGTLLPRIVAALEYLRGHLIGAKGEAASAKISSEAAKASSDATRAALEAHTKEVKLMREALQGQLAVAALGLPPVRPEAPSSATMVDNITSKVSGEFEKIARESAGPYVEAEPKRLIAAVEKAVGEELAKKEALRKISEDAARLAEFDKAVADRKKLVRKVVAGFLVAIAAAAGTWTWGKTQGHVEGAIEGKQAAYDEVRRAAPLATVAPAPVASVPSAPSPPAANAAPAKPR